MIEFTNHNDANAYIAEQSERLTNRKVYVYTEGNMVEPWRCVTDSGADGWWTRLSLDAKGSNPWPKILMYTYWPTNALRDKLPPVLKSVSQIGL